MMNISWSFRRKGRPQIMSGSAILLLVFLVFSNVNSFSSDMKFTRSKQDMKWLARYDELKKFHQENGHLDVPKREDSGLGLWVYTQRRQFRLLEAGEKSNITQQRISLLRDIGFQFEKRSNVPKKKLTWDDRFDQLRQFTEAHGHADVSLKTNPSLSRWATKQRYFYKSYVLGLEQPALSEERVNRLESLGFQFVKKRQSRMNIVIEDGEVVMSRYKANVNALKKFFEIHGHIDIPKTSRYDSLHAFFKEIRTSRGKQMFSKDMIDEMDEMGFDWTGKKSKEPRLKFKWVDWYKQLKHYHKANGNCDVPTKCMDYPGLSKWCDKQRELYCLYINGEETKMNPKKIEALEFLNFDFRYDVGEEDDSYVSLFNELKSKK